MTSQGIEKVFEVNKELTKEQVTFKKRIQDIRNIKIELEALSKAIPLARAEFAQKTLVIRTAVKSLLKQRILLLEEGFFTSKLGKRQKECLADVVIQECLAFLKGEEDAEINSLMHRVLQSRPEKEK